MCEFTWNDTLFQSKKIKVAIRKALLKKVLQKPLKDLSGKKIVPETLNLVKSWTVGNNMYFHNN